MIETEKMIEAEAGTQKPLAIVKCGSNCVTGAEGILEDEIKRISGYIADNHGGMNFGVVTSGAVKTGVAMGVDTTDEQILATAGAPFMSVAWISALRERGVTAGQILTDAYELAESPESPSLWSLLGKMAAKGFVPIINNNDPMNSQEIRHLAWGGDNDGLASLAARVMGADILVLLTKDVDGLMRMRGSQQDLVRRVTAEGERVGRKTKSNSYEEALDFAGYDPDDPKNSMGSKTKAAVDAARAGITSVIAPSSANLSVMLGDLKRGRELRAGTVFVPQELAEAS